MQGNTANKPKTSVSNAIKKIFDPIAEVSEKSEENKLKPLNIEEVKKQLLNSEDLINFVNKNSRYVERALSERSCIDLFEDKLVEKQ
jgi:hypothetical protein